MTYSFSLARRLLGILVTGIVAVAVEEPRPGRPG